MKRIISIFVLTGLLLQSFSSFVIIAHYEWNMKSITAKYCVNKAKPSLHCNGSCHLRKQLKAQEKKEQVPAASLKDKIELIQYTESRTSSPNFFRAYLVNTQSFPYILGSTQEVLFTVFHPPAA